MAVGEAMILVVEVSVAPATRSIEVGDIGGWGMGRLIDGVEGGTQVLHA